MRRILAILLFLTTSLPLASPLLALSTNDDANIPMCCRRNGLHHCVYGAEQGNGPRFSAPMNCPLYPRAVVSPQRNHAALVMADGYRSANILMPAPAVALEAPAQQLLHRVQPMRGPPSVQI